MKYLVATFVLALALLSASWTDLGRTAPRAVVLDVGQGDAIYIRTPDGNDVLVDAGPSNGHIVDRLREQLPRGDEDLELLVATHLDADHSGGMVDVLETFTVERVATNGAAPTTKTGRAFFAAIDAEVAGQNAEHVQLVRGQQLDGDGWQADVLWPPADGPSAARNQSETNDASIVLRVRTAAGCVLLTGDISSTTERELLAAPEWLQCSTVKVPHHGSASSSSDAFLQAIAPRTAVISVGSSNKYGHPTQQALDRLTAAGARIDRTDEQGSVTIPL